MGVCLFQSSNVTYIFFPTNSNPSMTALYFITINKVSGNPICKAYHSNTVPHVFDDFNFVYILILRFC